MDWCKILASGRLCVELHALTVVNPERFWKVTYMIMHDHV